MVIYELLILKAFLKFTIIGVLTIFALTYAFACQSRNDHRKIAVVTACLSLALFLSSWMVGVGILTYPNQHFRDLCKSSGLIEYSAIPNVQSMLLKKNILAPNNSVNFVRSDFNPKSIVALSKLDFIEEEVSAGSRAGSFRIHGGGINGIPLYTDNFISEIALELETISTEAEMNAGIFGEKISVYNLSTKLVYSTFTYFWTYTDTFEACPEVYKDPYNTTFSSWKLAVEIIGEDSE